MAKHSTLAVKKVARETDLAFLFTLPDGVETDDGKTQIWVPKSQMEDPDECTYGDEDVEVSIVSWVLKQNGLD